MKLLRLNWNQRNFKALNECLVGVRSGELAVFDWDNTCICGDIGEAVFRHQALNLEFKFGPERLREIIPDRAPAQIAGSDDYPDFSAGLLARITLVKTPPKAG